MRATSLEGEYENINIEFENNRKRIELYKKALNIFENITPKDIKDFNENKPIPSQPDYLGAKKYFKLFKQNNYGKLGKLQQDLMQYGPAIDNFLRAIELNEVGNPETEQENALTLGFLATSYANNGQINEAIKTLQKIIDDKFNCKYKFNCLSNKQLLSNLYFQSGKIYKSIDVLNSINLNEAGNSSKEYLCSAVLAIEAQKTNILDGNYNPKIKEKIVLNKNHFEYLENCEYKNSYLNLLTEANYWHNRKEYTKAIDAYNDALKILEENFEDDNYRTANIKLDIAQSFLSLGKIDLAIKYFEEAFSYFDLPEAIFSRKINNDKFTYGTLLIVMLPSESQQIYKGMNYLEDAFEYEFKFRQKIVPFLSIDQRLDDNIGFSRNSQEIYNSSLQLIEFLKERDLDYKKAIRLALNARINIQGLNEDIERKQNVIAKSNEIYRKSFEEIRSLESVLTKKNIEDTKYQELKDKLINLENNLYEELPELKPQIITIQEIAYLLPERSVLIEFQKYNPAKNFKLQDSHYKALLLFPNNDVISIDLGNADELNKIISALNETIIEGNKRIIDENIVNIYSKIFKPMKKYLSNSKTLYISPDSEINLIPFNTIKVGNGKTYLSEIYELNLISNAKELIRTLDKNSFDSNKQSVVFSNPDFYLDEVKLVENIDSESKYLRIGNSCKTWNYLEGTIEEGKQIKKLINAKLFTDKEATVNNLKSLDSPPKILHMATHGYFCEDKQFSRHPLVKSGVVLAGANNLDNEGDDDGYLTSLEAAKLNLKNTELVVLSACNTALGDIETGNGVLGLRRALSVAGARSTLLSLWSVDDFATRAFMNSFYQKLKEGNNLRDSLRITQEDFRNGVIKSDDPNIDWSEEFFWGAFQLSGDSNATLFN